MTKFAGKTAICTLAAVLLFAESGIDAGATGLSSILPAAGLGLELEEGQSVKNNLQQADMDSRAGSRCSRIYQNPCQRLRKSGSKRSDDHLPDLRQPIQR